jgi:hypothetical protein
MPTLEVEDPSLEVTNTTLFKISKSNGKIVETRQIDAATIYVFSWLGSEAWQKNSCGYAVHLYC